MELSIELSISLKKKGIPYFTPDNLDFFIKEIEKKYEIPICSYQALLQEENSVQLQYSFLTTKAIFDFTLKQSSIEAFVFFLKDISIVSEEITKHYRSLKIINGNVYMLVYKAFNEADKMHLDAFAKSIINEINKN